MTPVERHASGVPTVGPGASAEDTIELGALTPVPAAPATAVGSCAGCGAPLAADQRYCLACGRPASPVRLAFLDVLQGDSQPAAAVMPGLMAAGYEPAPEPAGLLGSLRRYSGLLALLGVLVGCLLVGLLVGHWISGNNVPAGPQVVKIEGLSGPLAAAPAAATATPTAGTNASGSTSTGASAHQASAAAEAKEEAKEAAEVKTAKPLPPAHKAPAATLQKIAKTTGKQHQKEINQLVASGKPIETGG